jgi:nicotinamidase-related amidase
MPPKKTVLLIIDPQVDFHPGGSLAVNGADEDSKRAAEMINNNINEIDEIFVTLDSHHVSQSLSTEDSPIPFASFKAKCFHVSKPLLSVLI